MGVGAHSLRHAQLLARLLGNAGHTGRWRGQQHAVDSFCAGVLLGLHVRYWDIFYREILAGGCSTNSGNDRKRDTVLFAEHPAIYSSVRFRHLNWIRALICLCDLADYRADAD